MAHAVVNNAVFDKMKQVSSVFLYSITNIRSKFNTYLYSIYIHVKLGICC